MHYDWSLSGQKTRYGRLRIASATEPWTAADPPAILPRHRQRSRLPHAARELLTVQVSKYLRRYLHKGTKVRMFKARAPGIVAPSKCYKLPGLRWTSVSLSRFFNWDMQGQVPQLKAGGEVLRFLPVLTLPKATL